MKLVRVLIVDDDQLFQKSICKELDKVGYQVRCADTGQRGLDEIESSPPDVVLLDVRLPDLDGLQVLQEIKGRDPSIEVVMLTAFGSVNMAVESMRFGAFHYLMKPAKLAEIDSLIRNAYEKRALRKENRCLRKKLEHSLEGAEIVGASPKWNELMAMVAKVARVDQTVLIQGESGTGKEVVARLIHRLSNRRLHPFVVVDCGSLARSLLESELFGHEKGAFTGAVGARSGLFEKADTGTLFVDEVDALETDFQVRFLRFLEAQEYRRLGATSLRKADVRIIAATNADLTAAVREGRFREDLFFRLGVIIIHIPPLRERREDIAALASHFLRGRDSRKKLSPRTLELLLQQNWPGNVRELRNVIERAAILSDGETIEPRDLHLLSSPVRDFGLRPDTEGKLLPLREMQSRYISLVLERVQGNQLKAAQILEIDPKTLYRRLRKKD
jgi:two-component system, NtrC family, response regulator AtoC